MAIYFLMGVTIILAGVAGLQFFYMGYLEKQTKDQKRRINELEKHTRHLSGRLSDAEDSILRHAEMIQTLEYFDEEEEFAAVPDEEEVWADVIEES